ncbi:MAG: hypothetical protein ABIM59_08160 [candidate division WOR-3 bacterium]
MAVEDQGVWRNFQVGQSAQPGAANGSEERASSLPKVGAPISVDPFGRGVS